MTSEEQAGRDMTAVVAEGDGRHRDNDEAMATLAEPIDAAPTEPAAPAPLGDPGGLPTEATTAGAEDQQPSKIREPIILPTWSAFRHHFGEEVGSVGELPLRLLFRVSEPLNEVDDLWVQRARRLTIAPSLTCQKLSCLEKRGS